ncbi:MAG: hypothetical protein ABIG28_00155 [archaeon]
MAAIPLTGGPTLLSDPLIVKTILPFLLVFTIVFAVLQKSKILGEGKKQIDAIVALVIGLLVISFGQATGIIIQLIPFLAVALVVILVFLLLVGSFHNDKNFLGGKMKTFLMIIALIAVTVAVLFVTNAWEYLYELIAFRTDSNIFANIIFVIIIVAAIAAVIWGAGKDDSGKKGE